MLQNCEVNTYSHKFLVFLHLLIVLNLHRTPPLLHYHIQIFLNRKTQRTFEQVKYGTTLIRIERLKRILTLAELSVIPKPILNLQTTYQTTRKFAITISFQILVKDPTASWHEQFSSRLSLLYIIAGPHEAICSPNFPRSLL